MKTLRERGFTLIELLIVIALLGALAVGLLATVDPFEQLKKGQDTSIRNTAAEFYNSVIRYYSQRSALPSSMTSLIGNGTSNLSVMSDAISEIANAGELKSDFYNLAGSNNLAKIVVSAPTSEKIVVCVQPQSKAFRNDQNTIYDNTGAVNTANSACPNGTSNSCYVCFQ